MTKFSLINTFRNFSLPTLIQSVYSNSMRFTTYMLLPECYVMNFGIFFYIIFRVSVERISSCLISFYNFYLGSEKLVIFLHSIFLQINFQLIFNCRILVNFFNDTHQLFIYRRRSSSKVVRIMYFWDRNREISSFIIH